MKPRPSWASKYDEPILEFLADSDAALPPAVVQFNLEWKDIVSPAYSTVKRRMRKLAEEELLEKVNPDAGYYAITEKGRAYLQGELDASELE
jgi:DNA-binding PadR family transcriptional regulator